MGSISLLIILMSTESDLKTATLEKDTYACLGMFMSKGGRFVFLPVLMEVGRQG